MGRCFVKVKYSDADVTRELEMPDEKTAKAVAKALRDEGYPDAEANSETTTKTKLEAV